MFLMAVVEERALGENCVLNKIVDDVCAGFIGSSERGRLQRVLIHGGDEESREYVCGGVWKRLSGEITKIVSRSGFEKMPDTYSYDLGYFLNIARSQPAPKIS